MSLSRLRPALGVRPPRTVTPTSSPVGSLAHRTQASPNPFLDTPTPTRSTSRLPRVSLIRPRLPIFSPPNATASPSPSPSPVSILSARLQPALRYKPFKAKVSKTHPTSKTSTCPRITPVHTPSITITSEPATAEFGYTPSAAPYLAETWRRRVFPNHPSTSNPTPKLTFFPPYSPPRSSLIRRLAAFSGIKASGTSSERSTESGSIKKSWWARWIAPDTFETVSEIRDDWQTAYDEDEREPIPTHTGPGSPIHTPRVSHRRYHSTPIDIQLASPHTPFRRFSVTTPPVLHMFDQSHFSSVRFRHLVRGARSPASFPPRYLNPPESRNLLDIVRELWELVCIRGITDIRAITLRFWAVLRPQMELRHHRHCCRPVAGRLRWAYA